MRNPLMDSDPTRPSSGPTTAFVEVAPATDVAVARKALAEVGADAAVVVEDGRPAGVVTAAALQATAGRPGMAVADVMDYEVVRLPPGADGTATLTAFTRAAWASLLRRRPFRDQEGEASP
jgi:CBS domain-containing protein